MIDIVQWRATIGRYHCRGHSGNGREMVLSKRRCLGPRLALSLCVALLMCCGDIESNPGPLGMTNTALTTFSIILAL